jgi:hypothetical protein
LHNEPNALAWLQLQSEQSIAVEQQRIAGNNELATLRLLLPATTGAGNLQTALGGAHSVHFVSGSRSGQKSQALGQKGQQHA